MITADIGELEKITTMLISISSDADEVLHRLRKTSAEIQSDLELQTYPQYPQVSEAVSLGVDALNRGNDTLQSLKNALLYVAREYEENEKKYKDSLARMTLVLSGIEANLNSVIAANGIVEQSEQSALHSLAVSMVSDSALEMQMVNIAALTKKINDEYGIKEVETIPKTTVGD